MTNRDVYNAAIALAGEVAPDGSSDYQIRSTALLALVYTECADLDTRYRLANGIDGGGWTPAVSVDLAAAFPLCPVFSGPAAYALAALLTVDENSTLSGSLYGRFASQMETIRRAIPCSAAPITDRYAFF